MPIDDNGLILGMQVGECVDNHDDAPKPLGRVKVRLKGIAEPSTGWLWPLDFAGHAFNVPYTHADYMAMDPPQDRPGDECAVWFKDGDPDQGWYMKAHGSVPDGSTPEVPEPVKTMAAADAPKLKAYEWEFFRIVVDERAATKGIRVTDKATNEEVFEYDAVSQSLKIKGIAGLTLAADGAVQLDGLTVTVKVSGTERVVEPITETL